MNFYLKFIAVLCIEVLFYPYTNIHSQENPKITSFETKLISSSQQNWDIVQDCDGYFYIANSQGILLYNGFQWQLIQLPNNNKPRTVFLGKNCKVYVGGYEFFGYIDNSNRLNPTYFPIADDTLKNTTQEIWNIFGGLNEVIFQSFSNVYRFDYQYVTEISTPTNVMLGSYINEKFYIPKIEQGLYVLNNEIKEIQVVQELPPSSKIASLASGPRSQSIIVGTQYNGVFILADSRFTQIEGHLNELLKNEQINKIIRLTSGDYVIGTILNGIYITNDFKTIKFHINKSNGLPNNTVLSLFEDDHQNLWVGLDKGLCLVEVSNNSLYFYDQQGQLGTLFDAVFFNGKLYLGTNQGVFIRQVDGSYQLIENSQGQVWSFLTMGADLLCGHNAGTFLINNDKFLKVSDITGGWNMVELDQDHILQATYTGLVVLEKNDNQWQAAYRVEDGNILIEKFVLFGHKLVGYHNHIGISILELNQDYTSIVNSVFIDSIDSMPISVNNHIVYTSKGVLLLNENQTYLLEADSFRLLSNSDLGYFSNDSNAKLFFSESGNMTQIANLYLANSNKPSIVDNTLVYNFDGGYVIEPIRSYSISQEASQISLDYFTVNGENYSNTLSEKPPKFKPHQNDLKIYLKNNKYATPLSQPFFKLEGWDEKWLPIPQNGQVDFFNLNDEAYSFYIKSNGKQHEGKLLSFEIKPHWYESWLGAILYFICGILVFWLLHKRNEHQLHKKTEKIRLGQEQELESERIKAKNDELEREVIYKSKMLANSAMTLVQKNKILNELKLLIKKNREIIEDKKPHQKLLNLIDRNINSDQDWEIFEQNFAEVHKDFLTTLTEKYPKITSGDLKLAAYIKMNLSSKEIAPLLDISVRSVENKRYRLRKKMGIKHDGNLKEHLVRL